MNSEMTRSEVEDIIQKFLKVHLNVTKQFDAMTKLTDCDGESQLWAPIWKMNEMLIHTIEELIGDDAKTLSWFIWDNDCGKNKLKHSIYNKTKMKVVKDVSSLLDVLGYK